MHVIRWREAGQWKGKNELITSGSGRLSKFVEKAEGVFEDLVGSTTLVGPIVRQLMLLD